MGDSDRSPGKEHGGTDSGWLLVGAQAFDRSVCSQRIHGEFGKRQPDGLRDFSPKTASGAAPKHWRMARALVKGEVCIAGGRPPAVGPLDMKSQVHRWTPAEMTGNGSQRQAPDWPRLAEQNPAVKRQV